MADQICSDDQTPRVLIFNQMSQERDGAAVFERLASSLSHLPIHHVLLTDYVKYEDFDGLTTAVEPSSSQEEEHEGPSTEAMAEIWNRYQPGSKVSAEPGIESALKTVRALAEGQKRGARTLITGSLYLVGGALYHLEKQMTQNSRVS